MLSLTMTDPLVRVRARLAERLAEDLSRIRRGSGPTVEELAAAPLLEAWTPVPRVGTGLSGTCDISAGDHVTTELFVLDVQRGYARTFSRLYRLGKPGLST